MRRKVKAVQISLIVVISISILVHSRPSVSVPQVFSSISLDLYHKVVHLSTEISLKGEIVKIIFYSATGGDEFEKLCSIGFETKVEHYLEDFHL